MCAFFLLLALECSPLTSRIMFVGQHPNADTSELVSFFTLCVCVCVFAYIKVHAWLSEDNLHELILSFTSWLEMDLRSSGLMAGASIC